MIDATPMKADTAAALEFLKAMHPRDPWHLCSIVPDGKLTAATFDARARDAALAWIDQRQGTQNLYFHVNRLRASARNLKAKKQDIAEAIALHVDVDDEEALAKVSAFAPPPTAIVFSGGGYQAFWRLSEPTSDLDRVERCNAAIAAALGGDNCHNIDRIMRLPGTINVPNKKKSASGRGKMLAEVVQADWSMVYRLEDFAEATGTAVAVGAVVTPAVVLLGMDDLPEALSEQTRMIILTGDDQERPRGSKGAHFKSRSEAVFRVACDLVKAGWTVEKIAGVLINPTLGISASFRKKPNAEAVALRQAGRAVEAKAKGWPDCDDRGSPRPTMRNAMLALRRLDVNGRYDRFRHRKTMSGHYLNEFQGDLSDDMCVILRQAIIERFNFDPRAENVRDAVNHLCLEEVFHPILDYLNALEWDGIPRIDGWMATYLGAEMSDYITAVSAIVLIAAVRRVRQPGVKFDQITVLEGPQGTGKSSAVRILAGDENHSDQNILSHDTREQIELLEGVWLYELGEVEGLNRAEVNRIKAFASRQKDKARMAYARYTEMRPRQVIFIGTTNEEKYLRDQTGNRRFWPVKTGAIDLDGLMRDRDQLWAEAAFRESRGDSITLPAELWEAAAEEQAARLEEDPWLALLEAVQGFAHGKIVRVSTSQVMTEHLEIPPGTQNQGHSKRLAPLMKALGWAPTKFKVGGKTLRGFERPKPPEHQDPPARQTF